MQTPKIKEDTPDRYCYYYCISQLRAVTLDSLPFSTLQWLSQLKLYPTMRASESQPQLKFSLLLSDYGIIGKETLRDLVLICQMEITFQGLNEKYQCVKSSRALDKELISMNIYNSFHRCCYCC